MGSDKLDYVLALKPADFLERRLQTLFYKMGQARSVHHSRVLIRQRHIEVNRQIVDIPSFMVRISSEGLIDHAMNSSLSGQGKPGRKKKKSMKKKNQGGGDDDE